MLHAANPRGLNDRSEPSGRKATVDRASIFEIDRNRRPLICSPRSNLFMIQLSHVFAPYPQSCSPAHFPYLLRLPSILLSSVDPHPFQDPHVMQPWRSNDLWVSNTQLRALQSENHCLSTLMVQYHKAFGCGGERSSELGISYSLHRHCA